MKLIDQVILYKKVFDYMEDFLDGTHYECCIYVTWKMNVMEIEKATISKVVHVKSLDIIGTIIELNIGRYFAFFGVKVPENDFALIISLDDIEFL